MLSKEANPEEGGENKAEYGMKRDMELIRLLLLGIEGEEPKPDLSSYSEEKQVYHSALLVEAGLVHGGIIPNQDGVPVGTVVTHLTWAGHEFLDAARSNTIWHKASERIKKSGVDVTISLLQELLKQLTKQSLGLP